MCMIKNKIYIHQTVLWCCSGFKDIKKAAVHKHTFESCPSSTACEHYQRDAVCKRQKYTAVSMAGWSCLV